MKAIAIILLFITISTAQNCIPRYFGEDSIVCVCNSTYCDFVTVNMPDKGNFRTYISSLDGKRFEADTGEFDDDVQNENSIVLHLNIEKTYQTVFGFGGAFTDSVGINIASLSKNTQKQLLQTYYGENGSKYNIGRIPIGGTDFSTRFYTLDDVYGDITLSHFSLVREDKNYKMPYMKNALQLNPKLRFIATPWTAPPWMKTNKKYNGLLGFLKPQYYQTYAEYLVKFLEAYGNENLPIWAISTGNEPIDTYVPFLPINNMGWLPSTVTNFIVNNLGPTIANSTSNQTKIWIIDDQRIFLPWYVEHMYESNNEVGKYIDAIAVHWYTDALVSPTVFDETHKLYPDKKIIMTEACTGSVFWELKKVRLGSWTRGENYMKSIIEDFNHWVTGWVDWNIALDIEGGPNVVNNRADSPIIVNAKNDEFYKQPMYYAIAHFSKFIPRGSVRIGLSTNYKIRSVAFLTPENSIVVVLLNRGIYPKNVTIIDSTQGHINVEILDRSMQTIIYKQ